MVPPTRTAKASSDQPGTSLTATALPSLAVVTRASRTAGSSAARHRATWATAASSAASRAPTPCVLPLCLPRWPPAPDAPDPRAPLAYERNRRSTLRWLEDAENLVASRRMAMLGQHVRSLLGRYKKDPERSHPRSRSSDRSRARRTRQRVSARRSAGVPVVHAVHAHAPS